MSQDVFDSPEFKEWAKQVEQDTIPKMRESACNMTLYSGAFDAKIAVEMGASILLDKPLIIVVTKGVKVPDKVVKVADKIIEGDFDTAEGQKALAWKVREAIEEIAR